MSATSLFGNCNLTISGAPGGGVPTRMGGSKSLGFCGWVGGATTMGVGAGSGVSSASSSASGEGVACWPITAAVRERESAATQKNLSTPVFSLVKVAWSARFA